MTSAKPGLLIVNADDLGGNPLATDRILNAFRAGAITSATAMVFMPDSERAAELARAAGLPVGLHLNLTQAYEAADVPEGVASRQRRVAAFLSDPETRRSRLSPRMIPLIRAVVADQLSAFADRYGGPPTHLDGHNHAHLNPSALLALSHELATRPAYRDPARRGLRRLVLAARDRAIAARHTMPDAFFPLSAIHPALGGSGLERAITLARGSSVEIMTHPDRDAEDAVLHSADWAGTISGLRLGSYADLAPRR